MKIDIINSIEKPGTNVEDSIGYSEPFYYCKEHPDLKNIND
jgi:hypothetical protein